ncbi:Spo0E family sporulation regulatory protein-aspartic acid phosphatase [Anaeromicrobium sediminis]|uniref:Spo0E family sporulation regulatory protein-aspartic acid phosphatase n=1 Tax=Anaeromicrobium sediminis TaxID=1478221 RepID=A0A267MGC5_9FIRM|nr:Spo0E family sporulation regulatory protein-aspartic acid phosphatase [Anaeromicrobium sediminis]PAB57843.1 hypothetical protein CCE28_17745 [Anaeromicrobium sediminis]
MNKKKIVKGQIERYKETFNAIFRDDNVDMLDEEILKQSKYLDKLIIEYYRENKQCE